ncbi:MAG: hypothetical protein ACI85O_001985, partial [Saprospiraceae bacterium]
MKNTFLSLLKFVGWTFLIALLTFLSQTGGVILLVFLIIRSFLSKDISKPKRILRNWSIFLILYGSFNFLVVPTIAGLSGKVPLPIFSENLRPHRLAYALLNRHYVTSDMCREIINAANAMSNKYPSTITYYLDGSHPIGTPRLYPHIKHKSGRKLDVCFFYKKKNGGDEVEENPSILGYGYYAPPKKGERDLPGECADRGSWWYGFTGWFVLDRTGQDLEIDAEKNRFFLKALTKERSVRRIFIEPHLKERFGMQKNEKIRFHGC